MADDLMKVETEQLSQQQDPQQNDNSIVQDTYNQISNDENIDNNQETENLNIDNEQQENYTAENYTKEIEQNLNLNQNINDPQNQLIDQNTVFENNETDEQNLNENINDPRNPIIDSTVADDQNTYSENNERSENVDELMGDDTEMSQSRNNVQFENIADTDDLLEQEFGDNIAEEKREQITANLSDLASKSGFYDEVYDEQYDEQQLQPKRRQSKSLHDVIDNEDLSDIDGISNEYNLADVPDADQVKFKQNEDEQGSDQHDDDIHNKTREMSTQTIITGPDIKLGSKIKKRIAMELGYFIPTESNKFGRKHSSSLSPIQMRSSSQKIAKIINEHKAQLKVMFDRYSNGLTHKIKLDGLTALLKDRGILKKLSLVPEITKAFHKSSFTKDTPNSLTFDEFIQCIIRLANELLSRKKKSKYKTAESRIGLFLAKLHLRPFPNDEQVNNLSDIVSANNSTNNNNIYRKSIAAELSPKIMNNNNNPTSIQMQYDYRLTEKQLDSEFDNYFNNGGFFVDTDSSQTQGSMTPKSVAQGAARLTQPQKTGPTSPRFKQKQINKIRHRSQRGRDVSPNKYGGNIARKLPPNRGAAGRGDAKSFKSQISPRSTNTLSSGNKRVKPSPLNTKRNQLINGRASKTKQRSSYQEMYNQQPNMINQYMSPQQINRNSYSQYHQMVNGGGQLSPTMISPTSLYNQPYSQQYNNQNYEMNSNQLPYNAPYNDVYYEYPAEYARQERELSNQIQNLTQQEQQIVRNISQRQQNQLRAVQGRNSGNPYGQRNR